MDKRSEVVSLRTAETIENEAADWLAKLDGGDLTGQDRRDLTRFLSRGPEYVEALRSYAALWSDMDVLLNELPDLEADKTRKPVPAFLGSRPVFTALAAMFVVAIGLLLWTAIPIEQPQTMETSFHATGIGKQELETFSDGSTAHLNTNSVIEIEYSESARIVRLMRGEALFDVAHDPARPFVVFVGDNLVKAVGTKFVVRLTSESIIVTVSEGQVQLSKRNDAVAPASATQEQEVILVSEGQEAEIDEKLAAPELKEIDADALDRKLSWTAGQLIFNDERLEQVILEISRYLPDRIIIDDPELRDIRINGRFEIGETDALLEAIEMAFDLEARRIGDRTIQISR
jgi:transmembrane sensor